MFRRLLLRTARTSAAVPLCLCAGATAAAVAPPARGRWTAGDEGGPVPARRQQLSSNSAPPLLPRRVLIDTDPGVDDSFAILLALGAVQQLRVEGLTIVYGNGEDIRDLGANAKLLLRLAGAEHVPVSLGKAPAEGCPEAATRRASKPVVKIHGDDHLGNVSLRYGRTRSDFDGYHALLAADFIYHTCCQHPGEVTLVCLGPLTNIAAALEQHPDLPDLVDEVVLMGGAFGERRGNRTPAAEANFFDDPEAARAVLQAGFRKVVLAGLCVTHQTDMALVRDACTEHGVPLAGFVRDVSDHYIHVYTAVRGQPSAPVHDAVPVMYLLRPDLFEHRAVAVDVETRGELTRGASIADWRGQWGRPPNCEVLLSVRDHVAFARTFAETLSVLPLGAGGE